MTSITNMFVTCMFVTSAFATDVFVQATTVRIPASQRDARLPDPDWGSAGAGIRVGQDRPRKRYAGGVAVSPFRREHTGRPGGGK
ncbi:hypothetical protein GCM10010277_31740 [Streptomyces longisporoflavus]|nr:hypothetical protein GCM10010277_31740 [Streptomyces longisporoflavus]